MVFLISSYSNKRFLSRSGKYSSSCEKERKASCIILVLKVPFTLVAYLNMSIIISVLSLYFIYQARRSISVTITNANDVGCREKDVCMQRNLLYHSYKDSR